MERRPASCIPNSAGSPVTAPETLPLDNGRGAFAPLTLARLATAGVRIERPLPGRPQPKSRVEG